MHYRVFVDDGGRTQMEPLDLAAVSTGSTRCPSFNVKLTAWRESGGKFVLGVWVVPSSAWTEASYSAFVSRRTPGDLIDVSRIRVAGLGGAGLTLMAVIAALQSPLTTAALVVSLIGGALGAVIVILHRRHATH